MRKRLKCALHLLTITLALTAPVAYSSTPNSIFIDQKDQRFYDKGLIPEGKMSSLCGPTSFLNLVLSDYNDSTLTDMQVSDILLDNTVLNSIELFKEERIDVNNGLQEYELVKYIERFQKFFTLPFYSSSFHKQYKNYGESFFAIRLEQEKFIQKINENEKQIWLIKLQELKYNPPYSHKKPKQDFDPGFGEDQPVRLFHFITKVKNISSNTFELIDPENPNEKLILELGLEKDQYSNKQIRVLRTKSINAFKNFSIRPPFRIELVSLIAE